MSTRVVLGGGLGGLAAAKYLLEALPQDRVTLLESSNRTGGWIKSTYLQDGTIFEQGPHTIRPKGLNGETTLELVEKLGIQNEIIPITSDHPAATKRFIYANGKLNLLPTSFLSMFQKQPPFSKPLVMYLLNDLFTVKKEIPTNDESIYDFVHRRLGKEVADYLISPMICGICAGNSKDISVKFLMETFFNYEQKYGNIMRGIIANAFSGQSKMPSAKCNLYNKSIEEKWNVYLFQNGMETLPKALTKNLLENGVQIELNTMVNRMHITPSEVHLETDKKNFNSNHVLSSIPADNLGHLVKEQHPVLAELLTNIPRVTVAVVNLKYGNKHINEEAFGFLTSPVENIPILGVLYDSCCNPRGNSTVFTVMMGGHWFKKYFGNNPSEEYLLCTAKQCLENILGISDYPVETNVAVLHNCIPQYVVGHQNKIRSIEAYIKNYNLPLTLCGSSYYGIGINDVIVSAKNAVNTISS